MQKPTMLCLLLAMTLVVTVKAQVDVGCMDLFAEAINGLAESDPACETTLRQIVDSTSECTDDMKKAIDECFDAHQTEWNNFVTGCQTITALSTASPSPSNESTTTPPTSSPALDTTPASPTTEVNVSSVEAPAPASDLTEPATQTAPSTAPDLEDSDADWPASSSPMTSESELSPEDEETNPEMAPTTTPEPSSPEPMDGAEEPEEETSMAPGPSQSRRLSRRLLAEELEEEDASDVEQLKRTLLQSTNPTCRDLFIEGGADAFHNSAASLKLSLLSIIGSILLGLMLI